MKGLRIKDLRDDRCLAFDLKDLLAAIGPSAKSAFWRCTELWCLPEEPNEEGMLEALYDTGTRIHGGEMVALADRTRQVIDGTFQGYRELVERDPWVVLRAVDSSWWEVFSVDEPVLTKLRVRFHDVEDLVADAT